MRIFGLPTPRLPVLAATATLLAACAAGSDAPPTGAATSGDPAVGSGGAGAGTTASTGDAGSTTTSSTGDATTSTSSQGGAGPGAGGAGSGAGGAGPGSGGAGSGSTTSTTTTGSGGGGAGPTSGVVTFFATKASGAFAAVRDPNGTYQTDDLGGTYAASTRPALTMRTSTAAVGLVRGNSGTLLYTTFDGSAWLAPAPVSGGVTTDDVPALASDLGGDALATFKGTDDKHYFARYDGASFDPVADPVGGAGPAQAFGPTAASIAVVGGEALVAQAGDDADVYVLPRVGAGWGAAQHVTVTTTNVVLTPAITAIDAVSGGDALVVFAGSDTKIYWSIRDGGQWSAPVEIADALTTDPPVLAATPTGAVVAFRGTNDGVYAATFDGSGFDAPALVVPITTKTLSAPALAPGAGDADAELAFVASNDGSVVHVRLQNGDFGAPVTVGGSGLSTVAIASAP